jgi:hypothetical protein
MEELETLFSSRPRVNILRSFLFQPERVFSARDLADQIGVAASTVRKHARELASINFLHQSETESEADGQIRAVWQLNKESPVRSPLHELMLMYEDVQLADIKDRLAETGDISLLIAAGVLVGTDNTPVDLLIVGERVEKDELGNALARIESAMDTEFRYTLFNEDEFQYRYNVYDKLIQSVFESDHKVLVDTLDVTKTR